MVVLWCGRSLLDSHCGVEGHSWTSVAKGWEICWTALSHQSWHSADAACWEWGRHCVSGSGLNYCTGSISSGVKCVGLSLDMRLDMTKHIILREGQGVCEEMPWQSRFGHRCPNIILIIKTPMWRLLSKMSVAWSLCFWTPAGPPYMTSLKDTHTMTLNKSDLKHAMMCTNRKRQTLHSDLWAMWLCANVDVRSFSQRHDSLSNTYYTPTG